MSNAVDNLQIDEIILRALQEDVGAGDVTTAAVCKGSETAQADFIVKADGIIAGADIAGKVFRIVDNNITFTQLKETGTRVASGDIAARVTGKASSILTAERTALNLMQRMSGIATAADLYVQKLKGTNTKLLDTRKTIPGLRLLDKHAVAAGGGTNHRTGLFDMFLVKDNHIAIAGSLTEAVKRCMQYRDTHHPSFKIEVEVESFAQLDEALALPVDVIMLDNFSPDDLKNAVGVINGRCKTEASGGITLDTIQSVAAAGVDYISVGAITHSVKALDISLEISFA